MSHVAYTNEQQQHQQYQRNWNVPPAGQYGGRSHPHFHVCVCCSVLQCTAVFCSAFQRVAVCYSVLECVAGAPFQIHHSHLHVSVCVLQYVLQCHVCCSALQCVSLTMRVLSLSNALECLTLSRVKEPYIRYKKPYIHAKENYKPTLFQMPLHTKHTTRGGNTPLVLQLTATTCNALQRTATHCNTLQHTATHCNTFL